MHISPTGPSTPASTAAPRRPGSIRRTTSISTIWPQGPGEPMLMTGEARDLITRDNGSTQIAATGYFQILASHRREILTIETSPSYPGLQNLVGQRAGANLRLAISALVPAEKAAGSPLYQLLDDFCGASLVAPWAWSVWNPDWLRNASFNSGRNGSMAGVCIGFAPGASSLDEHGRNDPIAHNPTLVPNIVNPDDPLGWHEMIRQDGPAVRRLRRIDVWREGASLCASAHFQDSANSPSGGRVAVHEYLLTARADETGMVQELAPEPYILPYRECPGAVPLADAMRGQALPDFRRAVLETLPGTKGCTHLNDMLRALADAPALAETLSASG